MKTTEEKEIWKKMDDWHYEVSDQGRVRNTKSGEMVRQYTIRDKTTCYVTLSNKKDRTTMTVPRLVMTMFNEEYANNQEMYRIIFKDKDRTNCKLENLEIVKKMHMYNPIVPVSYTNDIWIWMKSKENLLKKKKSICQIITNGFTLYECVYIDEVVKHDKHTYEIWAHEVKDNKQWKHSVIEVDLKDEEFNIKNTMKKQ